MPRQARTDHVALIGDLVASRQMEGRAALQRHLPAWLAELNRELEQEPGTLAAPLTLTAGDEIHSSATPRGSCRSFSS